MNGARNGATAIFFCPAPLGPGEGSKGQISFSFNYKVNLKDFGAFWVPRGSIFFFKHGHVAYQIDGGDEQNRMQVTFSS